MTVHFRSVAKLVGSFLMILGGAMLLPIVTGINYGEITVIKSFVIVCFPCFLFGSILFSNADGNKQRFNARDGFLAVSICWLLAALIGALPLYISGSIPQYVDAFFEMCSGFSTTGSTILKEIESLPRASLMWRSFSHWLGGMGIIVLAMAFLSGSGIKGQHIATAETPGPTLDKSSPKFTSTARSLYIVYLIFTVAEALLLMIGGMSLFDSLIHTFGTVGTGGFSSYNDSIANFNNPFIDWVIILFMFLCSLNFNLYFLMIRQGLKKVFKDTEFRLHISISFGAIVLICSSMLISTSKGNIFQTITDGVFQTISIMSTTGYGTNDYDLWPTFSKFLLLALMFIGGSSSSTSGGIKVGRIAVMIKLVQRGLHRMIHPNQIYSVKMNGRELRQETITNIANFVFFYLFIITFGTVIISINGYDVLTSFSSVLTCLSNVGPGFNLVGPTQNFHMFSQFSKVILSMLMIGGRLELFTLFILLSPYYWNSNKV
ncbi:TrkH family potassium uptake protein [Eubacteriales bacterium KG127]